MKWTKLATMAVLSFLAMYILMYLMVDTYGNVYVNLDQLYMVVAMTAAMMLIEMVVMSSMYGQEVKMAVAGLSIIALIASVLFIRSQVGVSDKEFLRSMIPHHGAALLMCENADLKDPEIKKLCADIIAGQQSQIDWMRAKLQALE